jgi:hypothetical protein
MQICRTVVFVSARALGRLRSRQLPQVLYARSTQSLASGLGFGDTGPFAVADSVGSAPSAPSESASEI